MLRFSLPFILLVTAACVAQDASNTSATPAASRASNSGISEASCQGRASSNCIFINAATIHDAYCGVGNQNGTYYNAAPWPKVHRMFYDALRVGGEPASVMVAELQRVKSFIAQSNPSIGDLDCHLRAREPGIEKPSPKPESEPANPMTVTAVVRVTKTFAIIV